MKRNLLVSVALALTLVGLALALSGCGTPTGVESEVYGQGTGQLTEAAIAADEAIAAVQQSDNIKIHNITAEQGVLRVGCDLSSPPLGFRANVVTRQGDDEETSLQNLGFEIDLCKAVANKLGTELVLPDPAKTQDIVSWKDLPGAVADGDFDVMVSAMKTGTGLEDDLAHATPHLAADLVIVTPAGQTIDSPEGLAGKIVGVQSDSDAQVLVEQLSAVGEIRTYPHIISALRDLALGELDAVVGDELTCEWLLENDPDYGDAYVTSSPIVTGQGYAFWCSKDNDPLLTALETALAELREAPQVEQPTTTTTSVATTVEGDTTTTEAVAGEVTAESITTTTTAAPLPEAKSVYQLICEKWGVQPY